MPENIFVRLKTPLTLRTFSLASKYFLTFSSLLFNSLMILIATSPKNFVFVSSHVQLFTGVRKFFFLTSECSIPKANIARSVLNDGNHDHQKLKPYAAWRRHVGELFSKTILIVREEPNNLTARVLTVDLLFIDVHSALCDVPHCCYFQLKSEIKTYRIIVDWTHWPKINLFSFLIESAQGVFKVEWILITAVV